MTDLLPYAQPTLAELSKNVDAYGRVIPVINVLAKTMGIHQNLPFFEANQPTSNKTSKLSYEGDGGTWRSFNQGVGITNPRTIDELNTIGMLEKYAECDAALAAIAPEGTDAYRNQKNVAIIQGMAKKLATAIIYSNYASDPATFWGLAPRLDTLNDYNIMGCGGTGSTCTSVYVVVPGKGGVWLAYPRSHPSAGIQHRDLGEQTSSTATTGAFNTAMLQVLRDHFKIACGLIVEDERTVGRLANIATTGTNFLFDPNLLIEIINNMKDSAAGGFIAVNRKIKTQMQIQAKDKTNIYYTFDGGNGLSGEPVMRFNGLPVVLDEMIVNTETAIS